MILEPAETRRQPELQSAAVNPAALVLWAHCPVVRTPETDYRFKSTTTAVDTNEGPKAFRVGRRMPACVLMYLEQKAWAFQERTLALPPPPHLSLPHQMTNGWPTWYHPCECHPPHPNCHLQRQTGRIAASERLGICWCWLLLKKYSCSHMCQYGRIKMMITDMILRVKSAGIIFPPATHLLHITQLLHYQQIISGKSFYAVATAKGCVKILTQSVISALVVMTGGHNLKEW